MATCGACGGENRAEARFCHDCGAVLAPPVPGPTKAPVTSLPPLGPSPRPLSVPADHAPPGARPPASGPTNGRPDWVVPVIAVAVVVAVVGSVVAVMLGSGGDGDQVTSGGGGTEAAAVTTPPATVAPPASTFDPDATATTADAGAATRSATLFSNFARLRSAPDIGASVVATLEAEGARMEVIGSNVDGWYHVRVGSDEGYLFGTFVDPPDPGLQIAQTSGGNAVLLSSAGGPLGIENESGPKVLVVDTSGSLWQVILADGTTAYVDAATVSVVR